MMKSLFSLAAMLLVTGLYSQTLTPTELLNRSMAFHDPDGKWMKCRFDLVIDMVSSNITSRSSKVSIDNEKGTFELSMVSNGRMLQWMVDGNDSTRALMNFRQADSVMVDSLSLTAERARMWRDYYGFLYNLPMKLTDAGTNIDDTVIETSFDGQQVLALKVTYDESVGLDTWYFYFNPNTYAMVGYRFYHDEAKNDGEYILLKGMTIHNGMRIPRDRVWYTNDGNELLGTDYLVSMEVTRYWD